MKTDKKASNGRKVSTPRMVLELKMEMRQIEIWYNVYRVFDPWHVKSHLDRYIRMGFTPVDGGIDGVTGPTWACHSGCFQKRTHFNSA